MNNVASRLTNVMDYHPQIAKAIIEDRSRLLGTTTFKTFYVFDEDNSVIVEDNKGYWYSETYEWALDEIAENWL